MSGSKVITSALHRVQRRHGRHFVAEPPRGPVQRPARVAIMLALAHKIRAAIDDGKVSDQAEAARRLGCTRARLTQLLDLTKLSPDLQEHVLFLESVNGAEPLTERQLRPVTKELCWTEQRRLFDQVASDATGTRPH